jgi:hypothetical protein
MAPSPAWPCAALKLFDASTKLELAGVNTHQSAVPRRPAASARVRRGGQPCARREFTFAGTTVGPVRKLLVLSAETRKLNGGRHRAHSGRPQQPSIDLIAFGTRRWRRGTAYFPASERG